MTLTTFLEISAQAAHIFIADCFAHLAVRVITMAVTPLKMFTQEQMEAARLLESELATTGNCSFHR